MSRPRSPALIAAIADVQSGSLTAYAAAKKHGVLQSTLSRALAPVAVCECCGQQIRATPKNMRDCKENA